MFIKKIIFIFLIFLFLWITFIPTYPILTKKLLGKLSLCNLNNTSSWEASSNLQSIVNKSSYDPLSNYLQLTNNTLQQYVSIKCKEHINELTLYKAQTISLVYSINQPAYINLSLHKLGMGPKWTVGLVPQENINKKLTATWSLDGDNGHKTSWLSGPYDSVILSIESIDKPSPLTINVYDIYIE